MCWRTTVTVLALLAAAGCSATQPSETAAETPTATADTPTVTETTAAADPAGALMATCDDPPGDAADGDGVAPEAVPDGQDLVGGTVTIDGDETVVTWNTTADIPAASDQPGGLFWVAELWSSEDHGAAVRVALDGHRWHVETMTYDPLETTTLDVTPEPDGANLVVRVPTPTVDTSGDLRMALVTEWGDASFYNDACPGGATSFVAYDEMAAFGG